MAGLNGTQPQEKGEHMTLKELLGEELYPQVQAKLDEVNGNEPDKTKHVRFVDLSEGGYISRNKYTDKVNTLTQQVTDLQGQVTQRDTDLADLNSKLTATQADAGKQLTEAQEALTGLQSKYDTERQQWEQKNVQQVYEFMVKERANSLKFSSAAAKKDFIREAIQKGFKVDGDNLLGYKDFVDQYRTNDPGAFVVDKPKDPEPTAPTIVLPKGGSGGSTKKMGLMEMMKTKNENPNAEVKFE